MSMTGMLGLAWYIISTFGPWFLALLGAGAAYFMYQKVRPMWAFVTSRPGDTLLLVKDRDGGGGLYKAEYRPADSTLKIDDYDPFHVPSPDCGINIWGRRVFLAYRGLGVVQSLEGASAALLLLSLGARSGEDVKRFWQEGRTLYILPDRFWKDAEAVRETADGGVAIGDEEYGGVVVDLSAAAEVAPMNASPSYLGEFASEEAKAARVGEGEWFKYLAWLIGGVAMLAMVGAIAYVIVSSVTNGGGGAGGAAAEAAKTTVGMIGLWMIGG